MKTFKIYGEKYPLESSASEIPDAYGFRNKLLDSQPKGRMLGYVRMQDGSIIECYSKFNMMLVLIPVIFVTLCASVYIGYLTFFQPKDVKLPGGFMVKQGDDKNIVSYNGFMAIKDNEISVCFQNGSEPVTIKVKGKGIKTEEISVKPNEYVASIPATFTTKDGVIKGKLVIKTPTSSVENEIVVEIPGNDTEDSSESGLEGYWKGEYVFGTEIE